MKILMALISIGILYNTQSYAGGSEVGNPWPWESYTSISLEGPAAKDFMDSLKEADEQFAKSLSASSSECVVDGFGGKVPQYSGSINNHVLTETQAQKLCYALHKANIMRYQPPNPSGLYTLFTHRIDCHDSSYSKCVISVPTNHLPLE